jgi:hypothetical protein
MTYSTSRTFLNMRTLSLKFQRAAFVLPVFLFLLAWQAQAVTFTLASAGPPTWTYTLTFAPEDNYNIFTSPTTITLSGLTGVTAAGGPTSTDLPQPANLVWTATVSGGGTIVTWSNTGGGTGNFPVTKHIFGFSFNAPTAQPGTVTVVTSGFAKDTGIPNSLDIAGPVATNLAALPVMSPVALLVTMIGLGCAGAYEARRRFQDWFGNNSNQA